MKLKYEAVSAFFFVALLCISLGAGANAAPIKKVLGACDNTPGCNYKKNKKNGDISGCSTTSGKCFYCPNDGKKQCFAIGRQLLQGDKLPVLNNPVVKLE